MLIITWVSMDPTWKDEGQLTRETQAPLLVAFYVLLVGPVVLVLFQSLRTRCYIWVQTVWRYCIFDVFYCSLSHHWVVESSDRQTSVYRIQCSAISEVIFTGRRRYCAWRLERTIIEVHWITRVNVRMNFMSLIKVGCAITTSITADGHVLVSVTPSE